MCGRFASFQSPEALRRLFRTVNPVPEGVRPSWNLAPSQPAMAVRRHPETGERRLDLLIWGLVPHWTKDLKTARRPANARAETVSTSSMFRGAFASRRCLVPVDAWYEWQATPNGKRPYAFARHDRAPIALAGLWEGWKAVGTGKVLRTFTLITTTPNSVAAKIHDRMPVVIEPENWAVWLGEEPGDASRLLGPAPDDLIESWPVSPLLNKVSNDDPALLKAYTTSA